MTSANAAAIVVVGSTMIDLVTYTPRMPEAGETLEAPEFELGCGGKGANQAVAAARLGSPVAMVAKVGTDAFGDLMLATLRGEGIDVTHVGRAEGTNGVAPIFVEPDGTNRILIVKGANAALTPADVEAARETIAGARLVVLQLEVPLETVYAAIDVATDEGVPVLLNPAPGDPGLDLDAACRCTFFTPNETELGLLTGLPVDTLEEVRAAARSLVERGLTSVVVTLGERGVLHVRREAAPARAGAEKRRDHDRGASADADRQDANDSDGPRASEADAATEAEHRRRGADGEAGADGETGAAGIVADLVPSVRVAAVDTTGAGDAFTGAFAHHWSSHGDVAAALRFAVAYAADSVTRRGTQKSYAHADHFSA